ncbi:MAG: beta-lactamase family protein [Phenylobacterium sp.]|nr:beta-lactamase family protein [Phenylobacterium sp.]
MFGSGRWKVFGVTLALAASARGGPTAATTAAPLRACIAAEAGKLDFSGVVLVAEPGGATTYARGLTAGPGSAPIAAATRFNIGSAGKMFTAVAIAQLIDRGRVGLDDPIGRYVPRLTAETSVVTVRQLLNHSSGLGNYFAPENLPALVKAKTLKDLLPLVASEKPAFAPGSRFAYSDSGFLLLGLLVEQVSGQSYGDYLRGQIFRPARMTATGLDPSAPPVPAQGMTAMPAPLQGPSPPGPSQPGALRPASEARLHGSSAGGGFSTAGDMGRFFAALSQAQLTSAASLQMLVSAQIVAAPARGGQPERDYGFGFGVGHVDGHRWFGHNGGSPGVNVETAMFPEDQVTVVVLGNRDPPTATRLFRRLQSVLFDPAARQACAIGS